MDNYFPKGNLSRSHIPSRWYTIVWLVADPWNLRKPTTTTTHKKGRKFNKFSNVFITYSRSKLNFTAIMMMASRRRWFLKYRKKNFYYCILLFCVSTFQSVDNRWDQRDDRRVQKNIWSPFGVSDFTRDSKPITINCVCDIQLPVDVRNKLNWLPQISRATIFCLSVCLCWRDETRPFTAPV